MVVLHFFISFPIPLVSLEGELLTYRRGRIALNGWANCPEWMGELQFAPTRALSERSQILYANSITGMA